jgi:hypothetical protein
MRYVVCDIDGVLAHRPIKLPDLTETLPYDYDMIGCEHPNTQMFNLLRLIPAPIILLTGRMEHSRKSTENWLMANFFDPFMLIMKPEGYLLDDVTWKEEAVGSMIRRFSSDPLMVIDDNFKILDRLEKAYGIKTFLYSAVINKHVYHW